MCFLLTKNGNTYSKIGLSIAVGEIAVPLDYLFMLVIMLLSSRLFIKIPNGHTTFAHWML